MEDEWIKKLTLVLLALSGCACKHEETELANAAEATCLDAGCTGDRTRMVCEAEIKGGLSLLLPVIRAGMLLYALNRARKESKERA